MHLWNSDTGLNLSIEDYAEAYQLLIAKSNRDFRSNVNTLLNYILPKMAHVKLLSRIVDSQPVVEIHYKFEQEYHSTSLSCYSNYLVLTVDHKPEVEVDILNQLSKEQSWFNFDLTDKQVEAWLTELEHINTTQKPIRPLSRRSVSIGFMSDPVDFNIVKIDNLFGLDTFSNALGLQQMIQLPTWFKDLNKDKQQVKFMQIVFVDVQK